MIVISDTTPLITLMKAAKLNLLHELFGEIIIPEAVHAELTCNSEFQDEADLINKSDFITVVSVLNRETVSLFSVLRGLILERLKRLFTPMRIRLICCLCMKRTEDRSL